jgi:hypothetical protein
MAAILRSAYRRLSHIDKGVGAAKPSLSTRSEAGLEVAMADTMVSIDTIVQ